MLLTVPVVLALAADSVRAQGRDVINPNTGAVEGYYSVRLQGHFQIRNLYVPQYGNFRAARITSLSQSSPLRDIGLRSGDVITRLDGVRVDNLRELDCHAYNTSVRFIRSGTQYAQTLEVYIPDRGASSWPPYGETP
jgi:S1-C subfamily serine protease